MAQSMAFINQKGGVGKTTLVANAGARWGRQGYRVLLIDLDPQAHLTLHFHRGLDEERRDEHNIYRVLRGETSFENSIQSIEEEAIDLVPSHIDLSAAEWELGQEVGREVILRDQLVAFLEREAYDLVLIDCPPSLGLLSLNALAAVDDVVVPVQAEFFALLGMAQLMRVVELVRSRLHPGLNWRVVVPTLVDLRTNLGRDVIDELEGHVPGLVTENWLTKRIKVAEAPSHGESIFTYAGDTPAADEFRRVCDEIAARIDLGEPSGPPVLLPGDPPEGEARAEEPAPEEVEEETPEESASAAVRVGHPFPGRFSRFGEADSADAAAAPDASDEESASERRTAPEEDSTSEEGTAPEQVSADASETDKPAIAHDDERAPAESATPPSGAPAVVEEASAEEPVAAETPVAVEESADEETIEETADPVEEVAVSESELAVAEVTETPVVEETTANESASTEERETAQPSEASFEPVPVGGFHPVPSAPEADLPPRLRAPVESFSEEANAGGRLHPAAHPASPEADPTPPQGKVAPEESGAAESSEPPAEVGVDRGEEPTESGSRLDPTAKKTPVPGEEASAGPESP